jgi:hypothetical protein
MTATADDNGATDDEDDDLGPVPAVDAELLPKAFPIMARDHFKLAGADMVITSDLKLDDIMERLGVMEKRHGCLPMRLRGDVLPRGSPSAG